MAILWSKNKKGTHYEVRNAGSSLRLYTNGVFHSQWNPNRPISGNLWDLLLIPVFTVTKPEAQLRCLVLGVGGGAVVNLLNYFVEPLSIDAVDLDPVHLSVAKKYFGVKHKNVRMECCEAAQWLKNSRDRKYDYLVEDLFMPSDTYGDPVRAIAASRDWFDQLYAHLTSRGTLVMNYESEQQFRNSEATKYARSLKRAGKLKRIYLFKNSLYENAIAVYSKSDVRAKEFEKLLCCYPKLDVSKMSCKLSYLMTEIR